jgi:uncharacterized integral membrane protein
MMDGEPHGLDAQAPEPASRSHRWVAPLTFGVVVLVPALVLIFSNTADTPIGFAWFHGSAPLWIILAVTFVAGAVVTRLLAWAWRAMRRRRQAADQD